MNNQNITNQETAINGDKVIITSTVEEVLTREDLVIKMDSLKRQREGLAKQSRDIKASYDYLLQQEATYQQLLEHLPIEELETL
ncbi:MAG: hypothetical protein ACQET8_22505 [Bacillota bacterium]